MKTETSQKVRDLEFRTRPFRYYFSLLLALVLIGALISLRITLGIHLNTFTEQSKNFISNTKETLTLVEDFLPDLNSSLIHVKTSVENFQISGDELPDLLDNVGSLIGNDFSALASEGQLSLESAANSAKIIDETLSFLSRIPFLNVNYDPEQPLEKGLRDLSSSFGSLPENLGQIQSDLSSATENISVFTEQLDSINDSLNDFSDSVGSLKPKLLTYQIILDELNETVQKVNKSTQQTLTILLISLVALILLWAFDLSLKYFANLEPVSGTIPSESRSEFPDLGDNSVSGNKNKGEK
ncbi:MAG TPA: hypothetical protein GX730_04330 [Chloroflexi bacterium]|jgi:methyl-accepting chemotaxis protein|nr:hypothetical protein [Chloroflexota bacterium]